MRHRGGVEECLAGLIEDFGGSVPKRVKDALRLYREERERVGRVASTLRHLGPIPDDALMRLADELERRDG